MKGFVITSKGIEDIAAIEIKELINADCKAEECRVIFEFNNFEDLCTLCYKCQSADRVLYLILISIFTFTIETTPKGGCESGHKYCSYFRTNVLALYT